MKRVNSAILCNEISWVWIQAYELAKEGIFCADIIEIIKFATTVEDFVTKSGFFFLFRTQWTYANVCADLHKFAKEISTHKSAWWKNKRKAQNLVMSYDNEM